MGLYVCHFFVLGIAFYQKNFASAPKSPYVTNGGDKLGTKSAYRTFGLAYYWTVLAVLIYIFPFQICI